MYFYKLKLKSKRGENLVNIAKLGEKVGERKKREKVVE
jgi:hypothetical protein